MGELSVISEIFTSLMQRHLAFLKSMVDFAIHMPKGIYFHTQGMVEFDILTNFVK